jgi:hypothetical protein
MDPVEPRKIVDVAVGTADDEATGHERYTAAVADVLILTGQACSAIEPVTRWTVCPDGESNDRQIIAVLRGRRYPKSADS